jgi:hypothetical protein
MKKVEESTHHAIWAYLGWMIRCKSDKAKYETYQKDGPWYNSKCLRAEANANPNISIVTAT